MSDTQTPGPDPTEAPDPGKKPEGLVGSVLAGRYRLVRLLGSGAMGAVFVGEHLKIGRRDAIKVLRTSLARDPEAVARFTRGARNASAIRHPNVCTVYDFSDTSDGLQFLAMELVDGESLTDILEREGPLPPDRAARIAVQAAAALQAAHELGIVHRDLKPDNIMIARQRDGGDLVKVVDFDIAKGSAEGEGRGVTRLGFVVGTPEYMSPEQLTGDPLDGRSDIFSLGLVFFRMITGTLPYTSKSTQDLMVDRLTKDPLKLQDVAPDRSFPPALQATLDRALARSRDGRCESARDFAAEVWEAVFGSTGETAAARTEAPRLPGTVIAPRGPLGAAGGSGQERKGASRRPLILGGAAVAAVAIVFVLVTMLLSGGSVQPAEIRLPASLTLDVGDSARVDASVLGSDGSVLDDAGLKWTSARPEVASVSQTGIVRANRAGTTSVRAAAGSVGGATEIEVSAAPAAPRDAPVRVGRRSLAFRVSADGTRSQPAAVVVTGPSGTGRSLATRVAYAPNEAGGWLSAKLERGDPPTRMIIAPARPPSAPGLYEATVVVGWEDGGPADTVQVTLNVERRAQAQPTETKPQPAQPSRLTPKEANSRVWNQLFILTDDSSARARRAVKDTTATVWDATYLPDTIRARAAYAHAQAAVELKEMSEGLEWARRASTLAPGDHTYRDYLRQLGGGGRP